MNLSILCISSLVYGLQTADAHSTLWMDKGVVCHSFDVYIIIILRFDVSHFQNKSPIHDIIQYKIQ